MKTWEEEFDEEFSVILYSGNGGGSKDIKSFIRTKIAEAEKRGEERERSKKQILTTCDRCCKEGFIGEYGLDMICQDCWANTLSPEDIENL